MRTFKELMAALDDGLAELADAKTDLSDAEAAYKAGRERHQRAVDAVRDLQREFREKIDGAVGSPFSDRVREGG